MIEIFELNEDLLANLLKTEKDTPLYKDAVKAVSYAECIIKPKFIYKKVNIDDIGKDFILIDDIKFCSKILANKIRGKDTAFVFIATGGKEIAIYIDEVSDCFEKYVLDIAAYMGCLSALKNMEEAIKETYNIDRYISLAPGSLPDWDVIEGKKIFELFGHDYKKVGVRILESGMIEPVKSVTGILFESEDAFNSCEVCMRQDCPTRRSN